MTEHHAQRQVSGRKREDAERIMVAAPRPSTSPRSVDERVRGAWAGDAGLALIVVIAIVAVVGALIGHTLRATVAGALIGGFIGVIAGFAGIYRSYRDL